MALPVASPVPASWGWCPCSRVVALAAAEPTRSSYIADVQIDQSTIKKFADESDNFHLTWHPNGSLYGAYGDGWGFVPTDVTKRAIGVSRINGTPPKLTGAETWEGAAQGGSCCWSSWNGKSWGMIAVGAKLHMWFTIGRPRALGFSEARIATSSDNGATWSKANWAFTPGDKMLMPTFMQVGQGYQSSQLPAEIMNYVYSFHTQYVTHPSHVQSPGRVLLMRELADGMGFAGSEHEVVGDLVLENAPHALDIVAGMAPVAPGVEIADPQALLQAELDRGHGTADLAGDEGLAAEGALVVEQDAVGGEQAVAVAVVAGDPVGVELGRGVGALRQEGRGFRLGRCGAAVQLGGARLVEPGGAGQAQDADGLEQAQGADAVGVGGVFRRVEADLDVALRREVVDLVGANLLDDADQVGRIGQVTIVKVKAGTPGVRILIEMIDTGGVEGRGAPLDAMNSVTLGEQQLGQIGAVLTGHPGDQCHFGHLAFPRLRRLDTAAGVELKQPAKADRPPVRSSVRDQSSLLHPHHGHLPTFLLSYSVVADHRHATSARCRQRSRL